MRNLFDDFFQEQTKDSFNELKEKFENYVHTYTPIQNIPEPRRIFTKVLNQLAFHYKKAWTVWGYFSKYQITYNELMYNRKNWRDMNKNKDITRIEFEEYQKTLFQENAVSVFGKYDVEKTMRIVRDYHTPNSEVKDNFSNWIANQVHHMFMKSDYPEISAFAENLVLLTPTQHMSYAHPKNNTRKVDKKYQWICLFHKSISIEDSINNWDILYSLNWMEEVINTWLGIEKNFSNIQEARNFIKSHYKLVI